MKRVIGKWADVSESDEEDQLTVVKLQVRGDRHTITEEDHLRVPFERRGFRVIDAVLMKDPKRKGKSMGWGFVFVVCEGADRVIEAVNGAEGVTVQVSTSSSRLAPSSRAALLAGR